jgi:sulfoxide reductase heme-binding subunit YedZ
MFDQVLWFATRGAGAVSQLMLTASVCFGLITVTRFAHAEWPRFFNYEMHRRISLLSVVFLAVHVLAAVFDPFTNLGLVAAIVPLASTYRPVQVALGVVALYLVVALIVTSLLRKHIGERTWRLVHWTSYAMWPLAMAHGITAGTDGTAPWMLAIDAVCAIAVGVALIWRIQAGTPNRAILPEVVAASSMRINGSASSAPDSGRGDRR